VAIVTVHRSHLKTGILTAGMPDGLLSNQKSQFGSILEGLAMENVGIFYVHLVCFTAIGNILWSLGIFCGHLVYFSPFWYVVRNLNLATLPDGATGLLPAVWELSIIQLTVGRIRQPIILNFNHRHSLLPGLPDGIVATWIYFEGLGMDMLLIFFIFLNARNDNPY
jgi:hypothetical protein